MTDIVLMFALGFVLLWFLQSEHNPLWDVWARWPRTLEASELTPKFDGLIRFGQPGSGISLTSAAHQHTVSFVKTSGPESGEFQLTLPLDEAVPFVEPTLGQGIQILRGESGFIVSSVDPARLEGLARQILRNLGHTLTERYRVDAHGPTDWSAVYDYFGLR